MAPAPVADIGIVLRNGGITTYPVVSGTQIGIYSDSGGITPVPIGKLLMPLPTNPVIVSEGLVITIIP